ncbi:MAG: hypothetical protein ACYC0C_03755 [Devosia sp.]
MTRPVQIQTTIPTRTFGKSKRSMAPHSLYLRVSFLELERQRHIVAIGRASGRSARLRQRIAAIEAEQTQLLALLQADPKGAISGLVQVGVAEPDVQAPAGIAIRY